MVAYRTGSGTPTPAETTPDQLLERVETWTDPEEWRTLFRSFDRWRLEGVRLVSSDPEEDPDSFDLEMHEWRYMEWEGGPEYRAWARAKFTAELDAINAGVRALAPELLGDVPIVELDHRRPGDDLAAGAEAIAAARGMKRLLGLLLEREQKNGRHDTGARTDAPAADRDDGQGDDDESTSPKRGGWIAKAISALLEHPDWTVQRIAQEVGVSRWTLSKHERFREARDAITAAGKAELRRSPRHRGNDMDEYNDER
jgi:hypothetical protein